MDRDYPESRDVLEDSERWPYNDLQSLAADLDYGPIVGVARDDLIAYCADELDLPQTADSRQVENDPEPTEQSETEPDPPKTDGGTQAQQTDAINVGHEGSEKLSPEGAPESQGTAVEPPEGLDADDIDSEVLESAAGPPSEPEPDPQPESSDDQGESGGLRERLGLGGDSESTEDVVEDADDPEERQRREEFRQTLEDSMGGADQGDVDDAVDQADSGQSTAQTPGTTAQGMVVSEEVVESLIEMPFNTASAATGWDGWELTAQERKANARLFVAACDEHDVDVGPTVMFALSIGGTAAGKAMGYKRHKSEQQPDEIEETNEEPSTDETTETSPSERTEQQPQTTADDDFGF